MDQEPARPRKPVTEARRIYQRAYHREWCKRNKLRQMAKRYGFVPPPQPTECEICKRPFGDTRSTRASCDHNHATGTFRGWLCHTCNIALGHLRDNPDIARAAARYLEERQ